MSTPIAVPAAQGDVATLFVGFELSKSIWLIGLYAPELGKTISRHKVDGGDLGNTNPQKVRLMGDSQKLAFMIRFAERKRIEGRGNGCGIGRDTRGAHLAGTAADGQ